MTFSREIHLRVAEDLALFNGCGNETLGGLFDPSAFGDSGRLRCSRDDSAARFS